MKTLTVVLVGAVVATALVGCGSDRDVEGFEEQMTSFLEERDALVEFDVTGGDDLVVTIAFDEAASEDGIVQEVWAVAHHDPDARLPYALQVQVPATTGDGAPATAAFRLDVSEPVPDADGPRDDIRLELVAAQWLVGLAQGSVTMTGTPDGVTLESDLDPASLLFTACSDLDVSASGLDDLTVKGPGTVNGAGTVTLRGEGDCDTMNALRTLVANAGEEAPLESFTAAYDEEAEAMGVTLTYEGSPPGTPLAQNLADTFDLVLEIA